MRAQTKVKGGERVHEPLDVGDATVWFEKLEKDFRRLNISALGDSSSRTVCRIRKANSWLEQPNLPSGINVCSKSVVYQKLTRILGLSSSSSWITNRYDACAWTNSAISSTMNADKGIFTGLGGCNKRYWKGDTDQILTQLCGPQDEWHISEFDTSSLCLRHIDVPGIGQRLLHTNIL